jgi:hypothetical protein
MVAAFTVSDCLADLSAGSLDGCSAEQRTCALVALGWLRHLDHAIGGARAMIIVSLQDLALAKGMSAPECRRWLAAQAGQHAIQDVLQRRTQIVGQPVLVIDANDLARPQLYTVPAIWRQCAGVELALHRVLFGQLAVHGEVGEDFEHPAVFRQCRLFLL